MTDEQRIRQIVRDEVDALLEEWALKQAQQVRVVNDMRLDAHEFRKIAEQWLDGR